VALRQTVLIEILRDRLDKLMPEPLSRVQRKRQRKPWIALLRKGCLVFHPPSMRRHNALLDGAPR
jgi:hypothetical protein